MSVETTVGNPHIDRGHHPLELGGQLGERRDEVVDALTDSWYPVARVEDLALPQRAIILNHAVVAFRDPSSGEFGVLSDRCPHRGASLSAGEVVDDSIQCPYHGWRWRSDGSCAGIPALGTAQDRIPPRARAESFPAIERFGLIWTSLKSRDESRIPAFPELGDYDWDWVALAPHHFDTDLLRVIENFRDVAHFHFVHTGSFGLTEDPVFPRETAETWNEGFEVRHTQLRASLAAGSKDDWRREPGVFHSRYRYLPPANASIFIRDAPESDGGKSREIDDDGLDPVYLVQAFTRPVTLDTSVIHLLIGTIPGRTSLPPNIELEEIAKLEDAAVLGGVTPRGLALQRDWEVHTIADQLPLRIQRTFAEWVTADRGDRSGEPSTTASG